MFDPLPLFARWSRARAAAAGCAAVLVAGLAFGAAQTATSVERVDAIWTIETEIGESSRIVPIEAVHPTCPSWTGLGGLVVQAVETETTVTITATFPEGDGDCEDDRRSMSSSVRLHAPIGSRQVIDGGTGLEPATPATVAMVLDEPLPE